MNIKQAIKLVFGLESENEKNHRLARELVQSYFPESRIEFKPESNGTVRFSVDTFKHDGFYRIRKIRNRGIASSHINSFDQIHVGKITIAFERIQGRQLWNFACGAISESEK